MTTKAGRQIQRRRNVSVNPTTISNQSGKLDLYTRSPITILGIPAEIVVKIFKMVLGNFSYHGRNDWRRITLTHVCRDWRAIAIGAQELWTRIDTLRHACPEQTAVYLERSGTSLLDVSYHSGMGDNDGLRSLYLTLAHFDRIRELKILVLQEVSDELKYTLFHNPAPALQTFSFKTQSQDIFDVTSLFSGEAPKLTRFSLLANTPTWAEVPIMRDLKRASIGSSASPIRLGDVYSLLSQSPDFERFWIASLLNPGPTFDFDPCPYQKPLHLQSLEDLVIQNASYVQLTELFNNIVVRSDITWDISCINYPIDSNPALDPQCIIPRAHGENSVYTLEIKITPKSMTIDADSDVCDIFSNHRLERRKLSFSWGDRSISTVQGFDFLCSVINRGFWCSASDLTVEIVSSTPDAKDLLSSDYLGREQWKSLLRLLPNLNVLTVLHIRDDDEVVETESHYGIIKALGETMREAHRDGIKSEDVLCPKLSELHLCGFNSLDRDATVSLMKALDTRSKLKRQLSLLKISEPMIRPDWSFPNLRVLERSGVADDIEIVDEDEESIDLEDMVCPYGIFNDEDEDIKVWRSYGGVWWSIAQDFYYGERKVDWDDDEDWEEDENEDDDYDE